MVADPGMECADVPLMDEDVTVVTDPHEEGSTTPVDVSDLVPLDWAKAPYA